MNKLSVKGEHPGLKLKIHSKFGRIILLAPIALNRGMAGKKSVSDVRVPFIELI